jgi:hypothetical protein
MAKTPIMKTANRFKHLLFTLIAGPAVAAASFLSLGFTHTSISPWTQLGIPEKTGIENIRQSFLEGYLYSYGASAAKKIATGDRVSVAQDVLNYSKAYVNSPEFIKAYEQSRHSNMPVKPLPPKTKEQIQQEKIAELDKSISEGEKSMKSLPKDLIEPFKEVQQMLLDQKKDYENPDSEMLAYLVDAEKYTYKNARDQYESQMIQWQKDFPADHRTMVKARLEKFLQLTAEVDFDATLKEVNHMKKFVNPIYENKPNEWKMAYRAGKPVVDMARTFASQWLMELN